MNLRLTTYYSGSDIPPLPGTDTFHSTELFRIYEATPGYRPLLVVASEASRPVAKLLGVIRSGAHPLFPPIFRRCEVFGCGEYFDENLPRETLFSEMLQRLTGEALHDCFLVEFRNLESPLFAYKNFRQCDYFSVSWLRVYNSLHSVQQAEERFSPSRIRQIKKGLKNGATVEEIHQPDEVRAFARMLYHNYSLKIRRHFPDPRFFEQLESHLSGGDSRIFVVRYKGKIIGGSTCIYSGSTAYLWFSGGLRKSYALQYPGVLAVWGAMRDAKQRGYAHMEFMDVGLPFRAHGYRDFVLRFGGKQVSSRRWFRLRWGWLNRLLIRLFQ